jgi:hypothetical protein
MNAIPDIGAMGSILNRHLVVASLLSLAGGVTVYAK